MAKNTTPVLVHRGAAKPPRTACGNTLGLITSSDDKTTCASCRRILGLDLRDDDVEPRDVSSRF